MDTAFINALIKWKSDGNRSVSVPVEYLLRWPDEPKIWCYDNLLYEGKYVSNVDELNAINLRSIRLDHLRTELLKLEAA